MVYRRGGCNPEIGKKLLEIWAPMLQIATPHLAEEWWEKLGKENLLAGHEIEKIEETFEINEKLIISEETYLKGFLEQARNVRQMAVKHMEKEPNEIIIQTSQIWKNKMARIGLEVQASGEKINLAFNKFQKSLFGMMKQFEQRLASCGKRRCFHNYSNGIPLKKKCLL